MSLTHICGVLDGAGKKRKAPGKISSEIASQLDETTEADKTQQVNFYFTYESLFYIFYWNFA